MPWKESRASDERLKFIAEVLSGDSTMTDLCRHFGISRKTGYKWKKRYEVGGTAALVDLSRRPHSHPSAMPESTRKRIIEMRQQHPTWGARKIRARLQRIEATKCWPAASTIHRAVAAAGMIRLARKRRTVPYVQPLVPATRPNQVWCMDFKGSFECGNGERCDTFTVTDAFSRFVLYCQAIDNLGHEEVDRICDALMKTYGDSRTYSHRQRNAFQFHQRPGNQQTFREMGATRHRSREDRAWKTHAEWEARTAASNSERRYCLATGAELSQTTRALPSVPTLFQ